MGRNANAHLAAKKSSKKVVIDEKRMRGGKATSNSHGLNVPSRVTTYTKPPLLWPSLPYLPTCIPASHLSVPQQELVHPSSLPPNSISTLNPTVFSPSSNPLVHIRPVTSPSHPAYPQHGLFAAQYLPPGTLVLDYTGHTHSCPQPSCASSDYDLAFLARDGALAIDSAMMGNESRFINDYHGIYDDGPNAVFEEYYVNIARSSIPASQLPDSASVMTSGNRMQVWQARMGVWVAPLTKSQRVRKERGGIGKGDEICVSYGKGWWRARRALMENHVEEEEQIVRERQVDEDI